MGIIFSFLAFIFVLTILVFVHELGHYSIARWRGVRVEIFSVGFGPEIVGWNDRYGTRWKISWVPFGGYVKFFGDTGVTSVSSEINQLTDDQRSVSFYHKPVMSRIAIVAAGPLANFLFAIILLTSLYSSFGQPFSSPVIEGVEPGSVADNAGFVSKDRFLQINGFKTDRFEDLMQIVMTNPGRNLTFIVLRENEEIVINATPGIRTYLDRSGAEREVGYLGVRGGGYEIVQHDPLDSLWYATKQTAFITQQTLIAVSRMITGSGTTDDLRGPIGIAQLSGEVAQIGFSAIIEFMALLSISLGLINLFPVPMLDGGHLLYYFIEILRGKPLGKKSQEIGFRIGLAMVLSLMFIATWNDVTQLQVFQKLSSLN